MATFKIFSVSGKKYYDNDEFEISTPDELLKLIRSIKHSVIISEIYEEWIIEVYDGYVE